jgi:hypothetical protein
VRIRQQRLAARITALCDIRHCNPTQSVYAVDVSLQPSKIKHGGRMAKAKQTESLNGWQEIAKFLGQPSSVAQRWAKSGMPVTREGRHVQASPDELNRWLVDESAGEPVQIATETADLTSELRRGLSFVRKHTPARHKKRAA